MCVKMNEEDMKMTDTKKRIQVLFRDYRGPDGKLLKELRELGLTAGRISHTHLKIENPKNGRCTFISLTPGDWRAGRKIAKNIYELLD